MAMKPAPRRSRIAPMLVCVALTLAGCKPSRSISSQLTVGRGVFDTGTIDVSAFNSNDTVRHHVLYMPFGEAAARLGSLRLEAQTNITLTRGAEDYDQADRYVVTQDSSGNFHVMLDTPQSEVDMALIGEDVFVRYDKGHMRQKTRRDTDAEALTDVAMSVLAQTLEVYGPALTFTDPRADHVEGRAVTRYRAHLQSGTVPPPHVGTPLSAWRLPLRSPPRWHEQARPLDVSGTVALDAQTGVVLAADLEGRLEVPEAKGPPTDISTRLTWRVNQIGRVATVKAPKALPEFKRVVRQRDPISFFRDQVPLPVPEDGTPGAAKSP